MEFDLGEFSLPLIMKHIGYWRSYNESLVRRGEVVLDFDVIDNWNNELDNMNNGKEGASYRYPDSFVHHYLVICEFIFTFYIDKLKV
jgi:hypothetical protein